MIKQAWKNYKHIAEDYKTKDEFGISFDGARFWSDLHEQFGAHADGLGGIYFDTEEGELCFILKYTKAK
jgi:hypothetical protein